MKVVVDYLRRHALKHQPEAKKQLLEQLILTKYCGRMVPAESGWLRCVNCWHTGVQRYVHRGVERNGCRLCVAARLYVSYVHHRQVLARLIRFKTGLPYEGDFKLLTDPGHE